MVEELVLNDRYRLLAQIGQGGMAVVYEGEDTLLGRMVAVKVLRPQYSADEAFLARFRHEAQAAANLAHPNIVGVYDIGQDDDCHYLVMEYVAGRSLKEIVVAEAPLPVRRALDLAIQMCAAVGHAHRAGIVHRDVKPQNVLVTEDGQVKVTDFGIARALAAASATETGVVLGTAQYLSPEQAAGEAATPASDVYALGVVLYEMLAGRPPFEAESGVGLALKHLQEEPTPLHELNPHVPPAVEQIVARAMAKDPATRYPTAEELGQALRDYRRLGEEATMAQRPVVRPGLPPARPVTAEVGMDWLGLLLGAVALLAVLGLIPLWTAVYGRYATPPRPTVIPQVVVPQLVGLQEWEARQRVEEAGLRFELLGSRPDDQVPPLRVADQTVASGTTVERGTTVGVVLSSGPRFISLPSLVNTRVEEAERRLKELDLVVERREEWSGDVPEGMVIGQEPPAGEAVPPGSRITLIVSSGHRIAIGANLDDQVLLLAGELDRDTLRPGEGLRLILRWQALRAMDQDYTVFVHLTYEDGRILAQQDNQPLRGTRPTTSWVVGEQLDDPYELTIPPGTPTGTYWIRVGMYVRATLQRLPIQEAGGKTVEQDSILVKPIKVIAP
ncbi:MAG: protein kinase [Anaerolineae bacterium]